METLAEEAAVVKLVDSVTAGQGCVWRGAGPSRTRKGLVHQRGRYR